MRSSELSRGALAAGQKMRENPRRACSRARGDLHWKWATLTENFNANQSVPFISRPNFGIMESSLCLLESGSVLFSSTVPDFPRSAMILIRLGIRPSLIRLTSDCMFFENVAGKMDVNSLKPKKKDKTEKKPKIIGVKEIECELAACRSFLAADQIVMRRYEIYIFERRSKANFKKTLE